jgi:pimeloyl-ACP methyl ester carboxylesterase
MGTIESVFSKDGTRIAFERMGQGPPLVMVHGSAVDHTRWGGSVAMLAEHFSLYLVDRRGRGHSGDGVTYAIEREFEDVAAVLGATGSPAHVLAHSYGAICALEAALLTSRIGKMVLYEPPLPIPGRKLFIADDLGRRLDRFLANDDRTSLVETFLRDVVHLSEPEISRLRHGPGWRVCLATAHTLPREVSSAYSYQFRAQAFAAVRVPTVFLLGSRSPAFLQEATHMASAAVVASQVVPLPGQGHTAMSTAPKMFVDKVVGFLDGDA